MGDDAHQTVAFGKTGQGGVGLAQGLGVQRTEAFVHEQGAQPDARGHLDLVGEAQGQSQGGQERLAAGKGVDAAHGAVHMVHDVQFQTALGTVGGALPTLQVVLSAGHLPQAQIGPVQDPVEIGGLDIGLQHDLLLAAEIAAGGLRQGLHPAIAAVQLFQPGALGLDVLHGGGVCGDPGVDGLLSFCQTGLPAGDLPPLRLQGVQVFLRKLCQLRLQLVQGRNDLHQFLVPCGESCFCIGEGLLHIQQLLLLTAEEGCSLGLAAQGQALFLLLQLTAQLLDRGGEGCQVFLCAGQGRLTGAQCLLLAGDQTVQLQPPLLLLFCQTDLGGEGQRLVFQRLFLLPGKPCSIRQIGAGEQIPEPFFDSFPGGGGDALLTAGLLAGSIGLLASSVRGGLGLLHGFFRGRGLREGGQSGMLCGTADGAGGSGQEGGSHDAGLLIQEGPVQGLVPPLKFLCAGGEGDVGLLLPGQEVFLTAKVLKYLEEVQEGGPLSIQLIPAGGEQLGFRA